jgi:hypothetical protein
MNFFLKMEIGSFGGSFHDIGWFVASFFAPNIWQFSIVLISFIFCVLQVECHAINKFPIGIPIVIFGRKLQKVGVVLHENYPTFVLLGLHLYCCFYVGRVVDYLDIETKV